MVLPKALLESLDGAAGFEADRFVSVHDDPQPVTAIRLNPFKPFQPRFEAAMESIPWCAAGWYLSERPSFTLDPFFHAGAYYVQDASSMFLWEALRQLVPDTQSARVLDLCAAPGGKSTLLASFFQNGLIVANEVIKSRAAILVENLTKWGLANTIVSNNDPSHFQSVGAFFDVMVIDAPCSGSGLFRKDPQAIAEWSPENVQLCSQRQQRILADALPALKEDGTLIYATCSFSPEEDEWICDWLVEMGMEPISLLIAPEWGIVQTSSPRHQAAGYRFYPYLLQGEGFFLAAFRKKKHSGLVGQHHHKHTLTPLTKNEKTIVDTWMGPLSGMQLFKQGETMRYIPADCFADMQYLASHLYIKKAGVGIGVLKGSDLIPDHELAMGLYQPESCARVAIDLDQALRYLRRQDLQLDTARGWTLVCFDQVPLGWAKVLPNRVNNYYPQEWRILKT